MDSVSNEKKKKINWTSLVLWCAIVLTHELPWFIFLDFYGQAGHSSPNCYHLPKAIRCFLLASSTLGCYWSVVVLLLQTPNIGPHQNPIMVPIKIHYPSLLLHISNSIYSFLVHHKLGSLSLSFHPCPLLAIYGE